MPEPDVAEAKRRIEHCRETGSDTLELQNLNLQDLPQELWQLTTLTILDLSNNRFTALPPEIGQLTTLKMLDVRSNQLTALLSEIGQLAALTRLQVGMNPLKEVPPELWQLKALEFLDIGFTHLKSLPPNIGRLAALNTLSISGNSLTVLPPEIWQLTTLSILLAGDNELTSLPPEIGDLTALNALSVWNNRLTSLPPEIGQLTSLSDLSISENQLTALPPEIQQLTYLRSIDSHGNPLRDPPTRIVEKGPAAIGKYFTFKERARTANWVPFASRLSRHFRLRSAWAAVETILMAGGLALCAYLQRPEPVWTAAIVAPLLLLKTRASTALGVRRFADLQRVLRLKSTERTAAVTLPFRLAALGLGSIAIRMVTTPYCFFRNPAASLRAMPENLRELCLEIDITSAPELVPDLEAAYDRNPNAAFVVDDLVRPYDTEVGTIQHILGSWKKPTARTLLAAPFIAIFFAVSTVYRLYAKAAAFLYLPLLLVDMPNRARLRLRARRDTPSAGKVKMSFQAVVLVLALLGLIGLRGVPELEAAVGGFLNENLLALWKAVPVSQWLPKGVLTLLLLQATASLLGHAAEWMARSATQGTEAASVGPVARRWLGIGHTAYAIHLTLIVALLVSVFIALAPNLVLIGREIWRFLF